jgi:serine protein kinase
MTDELTIEAIISEAEREATRYSWEGSFADYLRMVAEDPSKSRLSHAYIHDAIAARGSDVTPDGDRVYGLFQGEIFGLEEPLDSIVQYFAASAQRFEVRKRILLLLGPPASGKSTVTDLIKRTMEAHSRSEDGVVYAIKGCPMQEEPLHLIPERLRPQLYDQYGIHVEGGLCPRCRYMVRTEYQGRYADVPVERVTFSEQEAIGIGYFMATNPNPSDSLLVGSVNTDQLEGDRLEVAGKAFRLDGEFNVANRGMVELVEMFKADSHLLTTLLSLAQEQIIKMEKFGSVYADEVIVGHSNQGDFDKFANDKSSEALRDRIIAVQIPYNLKVTEEVKIYRKMMETGRMGDVHLAPLTLRVASAFSVLARLDPPDRQGMSQLDKLKLYDGHTVPHYSRQDVREMHRHHPMEGMSGISPRYVMNRMGAAASEPNVRCITPFGALASLWEGLDENVSYEADIATKVALITDTVKVYDDLAVRDVQIASEEAFEAKANDLLASYLDNLSSYIVDISRSDYRPTREDAERESDMRDLERVHGISDRNKEAFRREIHESDAAWQSRGKLFMYDSEPRLKEAIEKRLLIPRNDLSKSLTRPRFSRQRVNWTQRWKGVTSRLIDSYGYCSICASDLIHYVDHVLKGRSSIKTPRTEGVEWLWDRFPTNVSVYGSPDE